jgi:glycosyltransferase involved in cell wall biosynthesis
MGHAALEVAGALGIPVVSAWHRLHRSAPAGEQERALDALVAFHRRCARTFVEADDDARLLAERGVPGVTRLDRGVDSRLFAPDARAPELRRAWGAGADDCVLLHVGRLIALKNLDLLARAAEAAHAVAPGARLVIVGDGPERERLRERLPWAVFTGALGDDTLAEVYASADAFLFPSLADGFGNVVLEAMASGLGIALFARGAARQLRDGVSARCVPEDDEAGYVAATVELARDLALARRLGAAARARALELPVDGAARAIARAVVELTRR